MNLSSYQLINQDSGNTEYYTAIKIIFGARLAMGQIDLDPASSLKANERIKAEQIYTVTEDGLKHAWYGNIWLNHPFSRENNPLWISHLMGEWKAGRVSQFCCITFAATSEKWFQPLHEFAQCYLYPRTNYYLPDGTIKKGVTKGSVVTYGGPNLERFKDAFKHLGSVKVPA